MQKLLSQIIWVYCVPHVIVISITDCGFVLYLVLQSFRMSSQGGAAQKPLDQDEKEEEDDFYDCQETPDLREEEEGKKETQQEAGGSQDFQTKTETLTNRRDSTESETGGLHQEEERSDSPQEEEQGNRLQEYSDSDLKEDNSRGIEFDDDYLREVEKDLTEEEKEVSSLTEPHFYKTFSQTLILGV